jgi:signal transduction histidine kinase/DNA-binding response OmpR family regulator
MRLVDTAIGAQSALRARRAGTAGATRARSGFDRAIDALSARQAQRRAHARASATHDSRRALIEIIIAGGLALLAVLGLVSALLAGVRRPLAELVAAARRLAVGDLAARVPDSGPDELRALAGAFNAMADDLAAALRRLEDERARLDLTIRSLGDALLVVDEGGTVSAANPRATELLPELAPGSSVATAVPGLPALERALAGEVTLERPGQTLAATAARLRAGEENGSVVWTIRDVTERVRLERLKTEFVATASHELRSPLTSIKGFIELLSQTRDLDPRQREFVDIILVSTNRLVDLVNDLLDVARVEAGQIEIHRRPIELGEVVQEVAALMGPRLEDKQQTLAVNVEPALPRALADPARVRQILTNLITNAHLYTPPGGKLDVQVTARDDDLALIVADNGRGMSAEQLEHVFDRFYRGGDENGVAGTGLGLAIVKSLVDLHGGTIEVRSEPGQGSTFTVLLPRAPRAGVPSDRQVVLAGKRVLVIDDEIEVGRLIAERLAPFNVECELATSGDEGIARLRGEHFDAVTLDILMPGMTGFEVLHTLRDETDLSSLPVVVVSVFSGREALAGEWVVSKPIDAEELAEALGGAVLAMRVRVLVVGRPEVRNEVDERLDELGIAHNWAMNASQARLLCEQQQFDAALVDAGLPDASAVPEALVLRGHRLRPAVVVFSVGDEAPGLAKLDAEPLSIEDASATVLGHLERQR